MLHPNDRNGSDVTTGGVSILARHLIQLMNDKLDSLHAYQHYEQEALAANNLHALALIHECMQCDLAIIGQLRVILAREFLAEPGEQQLAETLSTGGGLDTREDGELEDPVDQAVDDTFPASDPPSFSGTSIA